MTLTQLLHEVIDATSLPSSRKHELISELPGIGYQLAYPQEAAALDRFTSQIPKPALWGDVIPVPAPAPTKAEQVAALQEQLAALQAQED
jgi:hypothetical protein